MTGMLSIFLAVGAGWFARPGRQVVLAVTVPYLVICAIQTAGLALGYGVNPPYTVTAVSYWVVQVLILVVTLGAAELISRYRRRAHGPVEDAAGPARALMVNGMLTVLLVSLFYLFRPELDPGSITTHTGTGQPPWAGFAGFGLCLVVLVVLGLASLARRVTHAVSR